MDSIPTTNVSFSKRVAGRLNDALAELKSWRRARGARRTAEGMRQIAGLSARDLMYCFESLGDNCEFGIVQRRCGVEPLGLFRFASIGAASLARALEAGLKDIVAADALEVVLSNGRYVAQHGKYDIKFGHSGFEEADIAPERALPLMIQRLRFLARKLIDALSQGEKILVCRTRHAGEIASVLRAGAALRRLGPNHLLWVAPATGPSESGSVRWIADGVMHGQIEADSDWDNLRFDTWMTICERAYILHRDDRAAATIAPAAILTDAR